MAKFEKNDPRINKNGAPTKQYIVEEWFKQNPQGSATRCAKETGLSKNTVIKWRPEECKPQPPKQKTMLDRFKAGYNAFKK